MQKEKKKKEETDEMRQDIFLRIILVWILTFTLKIKIKTMEGIKMVNRSKYAL